MKKHEGLINPTPKTQYYQCRFYSGAGVLKRLSTGETDYHAAWQSYQALRKAHGAAPDTDRNTTLGSILALYETEALARIKSKKGHRSSVKALYNYWTPDTAWADICKPTGRDSIHQYIRWRSEQVKAATIRRQLAVLSAAAEHAIKQGIDIHNPRGMIKLRIVKPDYYWLKEEQATALLKACLESKTASENQRALHDFVKISLFTGMRTGEVLKLTTNRVSMTHEALYLDDSKAGKAHSVPISDEIKDCLKRRIRWAKHHQSPYLFVNPKTKTKDSAAKPFGTLIKPFKRACKLAGIPVNKEGSEQRGMRVYDLRHTCATWLVQNGTPISEVCDLLNHSDIKMTMIYAHHSPTGRAATVKRLPSL